MVYEKKTNKFAERLILAPQIVFFYTDRIKIQFFLKQLCEQVECEDVDMTFLVRIFEHF
jgi:hypothetical protein